MSQPDSMVLRSQSSINAYRSSHVHYLLRRAEGLRKRAEAIEADALKLLANTKKEEEV
jgi:hypothetical protein